MVIRYYSLEKETKEYLKYCSNAKISPFTDQKTLNDYIIARKANSKIPIIYDPSVNKKNISPLQIWLDGSDGNTFFDNNVGGSIVTGEGVIGRWVDKSGFGRNFVQSNSIYRPSKKINAQNGLSSVSYNGTSNMALENADTSFQVKTIFIVAYYAGGYSTWPASYQGIFTIGNNESVIASSSGSNILYNSVTSATISKRYINGTSTTVFLPSPIMKTIYTELSNSVSGASNIGRDRFFATRSWNGYIAEILAFNTIMNLSEYEAIEFYLAKKWKCY